MIRSAILGASMLMLAGPAFAADLPVAPEPIDYLRICDAYGNQFFYLPGTETCLRVGGRVRIEARLNNYGSGPNNWSDKAATGTTFRARGYSYLDSRTATEYGLLRTYNAVFVTNDNDSSSNSLELEYSFIQFGGFTFGRAQSFWDFWTGYSFGARVTSYSDTKSNVAAYTRAFGNGVSASLSIESPVSRRVELISPNANGYGGFKIPDAVANIRIDQAWGSAQIMGALHQVYFVDTASKSALGWAVGAGAEIKVPFLGDRDKVVLQVGYSDGASRFPLDSWNGRITDAINVGGSTKTTKTWNIAGGWRHAVTDTVTANLEGGYHTVDAALDSYDFNQWTVTGNLVWSPVSSLDIGAEMQYRNVDFDRASGLSDTDEIYTTLRVQKTF
ncbi:MULTISPECIES: porin [unclassified Roseibium]|uniref:porin n=1 Tax=unclassified Roseibium TaxID=2629323 RepID=UPI00273D3B6C|nr:MULTISPECIES: porin [unclassified Roseibium]